MRRTVGVLVGFAVAGLGGVGISSWVAPEALRGMAPGEERRVTVRIQGVPSLVTAMVRNEMVTVRRAIDGATDGGDGSGEGPR